jgi:hypothetical protein
MPEERVDVLRPKLVEAQKALDAALEEACETDVKNADSAELIRLEESLTIARDAAKQAISVIRRLHQEQQEVPAADSSAHRSFVDDQGVQWDAFEVFPSRATLGRSTLPAPYQEGWLAMQCPDGIRRLTPIPQGWRELSRAQFCELLEKAALAPRRTRSGPTKT